MSRSGKVQFQRGKGGLLGIAHQSQVNENKVDELEEQKIKFRFITERG